MDDDRCDKCGEPVPVGGWPWCPHGVGRVNSVIPDDYGRDIVCETMAHHPVTYRTRSERRRLMKQYGVEEFVRHQPVQGSDRSTQTTDWSRGSVDLDGATSLLERMSGRAGKQTDAPAVPHTWTVRELPKDA